MQVIPLQGVRCVHPTSAQGSSKIIFIVEGCRIVFQTTVQQNTIKAETMWSMFVAKHNLAFLTTDHATKMFKTMFADSEIARKFACIRSKTTAIVKEALAPYYHNKIVDNKYCVNLLHTHG